MKQPLIKMSTMSRSLILHPFLFSIYPAIALFSTNVEQIQLWEIRRPVILILLGCVGLLLALKLVVKDWGRAGLLCSSAAIIFFAYGHVYWYVENLVRQPLLFSPHRFFFNFIWVGLFLVSVGICRRLDDTREVTRFLNIVAIVLVLLPGFHIISFTLQNIGDARMSLFQQEDTSQTSNVAAREQWPDIYYIIVDGYGRADVLAEVYSHDNSEFLDFLTDRGFYMASNSHSNYSQTALSLSSSLNYRYINTLSDKLGRESNSRAPLDGLIKDNRVHVFLGDQGYQTVAFTSGYSYTEMRDADLYITAYGNLNSFESTLLTNSMAVVWLNKKNVDNYRRRIINNLKMLGHMSDVRSPKFVFAHIIAPHPPFMFGPNGEVIGPKKVDLSDGSHWQGDRNEYIDGYRGQLVYLNQLLEKAIDGILANSETDPIIILQGDHGPGAFLNWESVEDTCLKERMSILNAYHLPGNGAQQLYASITPVNSFRVVFDTYFDANLGLVKDEVYFSLWDRPYDFIKVTDQLEPCTDSSQASGTYLTYGTRSEKIPK
jgi:hypothetical protein